MAPASFLLQRLKNLPESSEDIDSLVHDITPEVCGRELTLHEVVEALGSSLTHERPREREVGTQFLAGVLGELPPAYLNPAEASFMTAFLVDRLQDHHTVQPAVFLSCLALVKQEKLGDGEMQSLVEGIFREVQVQSHTVSDRRTVYSFLKYCLCNRPNVLKELGLSLLPGLVAAVEGEGDPRNLLVVFSLVTALIQSGLALEPFVEELFEVVAAYFPIEFVPPRGDPYAIQVEDLVLGLRGVLASTPLFAPFCLPLLQEKLDSDLTSAKLDSLHTLVACCEVYSAEAIHPHIRSLWDSLCREVMEGANKDVEEAALSALTAVVRVLEVESPLLPPRLLLPHSSKLPLLLQCECHLRTPEQRLMWPSTRLLVALVVAAPGPAATITGKVVPQLASQCLKKDGTALAHQNTISSLAMVLEAATKHPHLLLENGHLSQLAGPVWEAFHHGLSCDEGSQIQTATLASLPPILPALPSSHLQQAAQELTALLLDPSSSPSLREGIKKCLVRLGQHNPEVILKHTCHLWTKASSGKSEVQVLESLAFLASSKAVLAPVLTAMWGCAQTLLTDGSLECFHCYLSTIAKMVENNLTDNESQQFLLEEWRGTQQILTIFTRLIQHCHPPHTPALLSLASILRSLVASESTPQPLVQHLVTLAVHGAEENSGGADTLLLPDSTPEMKKLLTAPLDYTDPSGSNMLYALEGVIAGAQSLSEESTCVLQLLRKTRVFSASTGDAELREVAALLHAAAINKLQEGAQLSQAEEEARTDVEAALDPAQPKEKRLAALLVTTWTCKALVVCGSNLQQWWTKKLLDLLEDPELGVATAHSFETIVKEHPYALSPAYHARTRLLHRQRFFEGVVHPIVDTFSTSKGSLKTCCQVALCSLMPHLPQAILAPHVNKVLPVVLQGVTKNEGRVVVESVVETLASLLQHSPAPATQHLSFLLPALLSLTTNQPMTVRTKALECLDALATLPTTSLLPYRDDVLQGLKAALDDHKRVVRHAAASTRTVWIMVGAPGGS
ncbi:MMS19 nucleotide excision repair protein homolog [Portunus trituberculatus]|uniref:MMS19 nucleotide excision repair protein homolog n=1 Tax=Portunus trituberculatus TaxID=210409 RepID=UPI001E1CC552|nr:MMS19 nucleotide excision repair protein homolog [Portunus trituberculatus]